MNPPRIRWVVFFAGLSFLAAVLLTSLFKEMRKVDKLSAILDERMEELVKEERRNQELERDIKYYSTPEGIARLAREEFNMVRPGEKLYKIKVISNDKKQSSGKGVQ